MGRGWGTAHTYGDRGVGPSWSVKRQDRALGRQRLTSVCLRKGDYTEFKQMEEDREDCW